MRQEHTKNKDAPTSMVLDVEKAMIVLGSTLDGMIQK